MRARAAAWVLLVASACGASDAPPPELARIEGDLQRAAEEWSEVAWGAPPDESQRAETSRRARCMWDELTRAGRDPAPDLECLVRRMRAVTRCHRATSPGETPRCEDEYESACPVSPEFTRIAESTCRPAARR